MGPPSYIRSVVDRNVVMWRMTVVSVWAPEVVGTVLRRGESLLFIHKIARLGFVAVKPAASNVKGSRLCVCVCPFRQLKVTGGAPRSLV